MPSFSAVMDPYHGLTDSMKTHYRIIVRGGAWNYNGDGHVVDSVIAVTNSGTSRHFHKMYSFKGSKSITLGRGGLELTEALMVAREWIRSNFFAMNYWLEVHHGENGDCFEEGFFTANYTQAEEIVDHMLNQPTEEFVSHINLIHETMP